MEVAEEGEAIRERRRVEGGSGGRNAKQRSERPVFRLS
jgi:hypothetical protein